MHSTKNKEIFKTLINTKDWTQLYKSTLTAQECYSMFHNYLLDCYNQAFPEITVSKKDGFDDIKWETDSLKTYKNKLDALYTILEVTQATELYVAYKILKDNYFEKVNEIKRQAYDNFISTHDNKISAAWKLVKLESGRSQRTSQVTHDSPSAEEFNSFLSRLEVFQETKMIQIHLCLCHNMHLRIH